MQTFLMAAEVENFRIVAEKLFMTQPAITSKMRILEKELGEKLFIKNGRNIKLTEFGRLFYREAQEIISQFDKSMEAINRYKQGFQRTIRIAMSPMFTETILPSILRAYIDENPYVEVSIQVVESLEISSLIENGEVDIGLSCIPGLSDVQSIKFHEEPISLVCNHDGYDSEIGPVIDAKELLENNILFTDNHPSYWGNIKEQLKQLMPTLRMMKVNQTHATKRFVMEGIGISFLPKSIIKRELMEGRILEVPIDFIDVPTSCMYIICKHGLSIEKEFVHFITNYHYS
nr:LysR family transcriptional regulator [Oceanobacillus polygoni]